MYSLVSPKEARRYLRDIKESEKHFYANDRSVLRNIFDLYDFVRTCDDNVFRTHVNGERNDFADWIRHVVMDKELADRIETCLVRQPMQYRILRRINFLVLTSSKRIYGPKKASVILEEVVAPEEHFMARNGRILRNLWELNDFIKTADDETFRHHVNTERNDIAEWVDNIMLDTKLADSIREVLERDEMRLLIELRLRLLERMVRLEKEQMRARYLQEVMNAMNRY